MDNYILHLETATEVCSVALAKDGQLLAYKNSSEAYVHSSQLTIYIQEVLAAAKVSMQDLSAVAISQGPGSYTGLRVGAATAKGICFALNIPLIAVSSLKSIAWGMAAKFPDGILYIPMIDARRMEVYMAVYDSDLHEVEAARAQVIDDSTLLKYIGPKSQAICLAGNGTDKLKSMFEYQEVIFGETYSDSRYMVDLAYEKFLQGMLEDVAYFEPFYLKPPNITVPKRVI